MTDEAPSSPAPTASGNPAPTCVCCKYSLSTSLQQPLYCRRFPPTTMFYPQPGPRGVEFIANSDWPRVQRTAWCGEFTPKFSLTN